MEVGSPFGSKTRTQVLLALRLLEQTYPRELARLLGVPLSVVQKAMRTLERDSLVVGRAVGRTRSFQINPRYFAVKELVAYLARLLEPESKLKQRAALIRKRPRQTGKRL
jgi:DNA-binding transcriptional ArsR family regulator